MNVPPPRKSHLASALLLLLILLTICIHPWLDAHLQAIAVLNLVAGKPVPHALIHICGTPTDRQTFTLSTSQGPIPARLYTPVGHPGAPAFLLLHGVHHLGMEEPRLIAFAGALASCNLRVLTPELPDIKDYHVGASSIATIGDTAHWLASQNIRRDTLVTPAASNPVPVMGLSFSGGLALLAASSPQYQRDFQFVVAIGSQNSMSRVAEYYRTGKDPLPNGLTETLPPHEYGPLVLEYENLQDFAPAPDLPILRAMLRAHLYEDGPAERAAVASMSPTQAAEGKQLLDASSHTTLSLLEQDEHRHLAEMAAVSPEGHLASLTIPVYLLHGEGDNIIPSAETLWMARQIPASHLQQALISPVLSHLNLDGKGPSPLDNARLLHFFALILHAAEHP